MSKLIGYFKNSFEQNGKVIEYAKVLVGDPIQKDGAGVNVVAHKAALEVIDTLKPELIGKECTCYFDQYKRVMLVQFK